MAVRTTAGKNSANAGKKSGAEQKVVVLAEKLGWFLGTARARADGWIGNPKVKNELTRIRDGAAQLLQHIDAAARAAVMESGHPKAAAKPAGKPKSAALNVKPSRGAVDAPGKRHRKPPPQEHLDKRMGEPVGKQMGQKSFQVGKSRGRG